MKTKSYTITLPKGRALTFFLWQDLSITKIANVHVLIGFSKTTGERLNAMERLDTYRCCFGPFGIAYSVGYLRGEETV